MSDHNTVQNPQPSAPARMKLARHNILLAAVLLVQLGLAAFVFWPSTGSAATGEPLLRDLTLDDVTAMTITDNNDRSVRVERGDEGWVLADSEGFPAKSQEITTTLTSLLDINRDRLVTRTEASHSRLQVADNNFMRRIDLETTDGDLTLYLGSSSGASATHVRLAGEDAAYLTNQVTSWQLDTLTSNWINTGYFNISKDDITAMMLENANGRFEFVKVDDEWTLADATEDENVASANINTILNRVASINMTRPLGKSEDPAYGMDDPSAVITIQVDGEDGPQTYTLTQGPLREDDNLYPLKSSESPYYVLIAKYIGDELANKQRQDFMIAESAAEDEDEASDAETADDTAADDTAADDAAADDTAADDAATEDTAAEDTTAEDTPDDTAADGASTTEDDTENDTEAADASAEESTPAAESVDEDSGDAVGGDADTEESTATPATPEPTAETTPAE